MIVIMGGILIFLFGACFGALIADCAVWFTGTEADRDLEKLLRGRRK